jgi:hypothetical protein
MRSTTFLAILSALFITFGGTLFLIHETLRPEEAQAQEESCPSPGAILLQESGGDTSLNAQGNANYGPFTTNSDSFVVTMDASSSQPGGAAVSVSQLGTTPNPLVIREQAFQTPGTESLLIQEGPGEYVVSIGYGGSDYTVTVEECASGSNSGASPGNGESSPAASSPSETTNASPAPSETTSASPAPSETTSASPAPSETTSASPAPSQGSASEQAQDEEVLDSGGPSYGPVPVMADGRCPAKHPLKKDDACYKSKHALKRFQHVLRGTL